MHCDIRKHITLAGQALLHVILKEKLWPKAAVVSGAVPQGEAGSDAEDARA